MQFWNIARASAGEVKSWPYIVQGKKAKLGHYQTKRLKLVRSCAAFHDGRQNFRNHFRLRFGAEIAFAVNADGNVFGIIGFELVLATTWQHLGLAHLNTR
jgi:hypothetical protein